MVSITSRANPHFKSLKLLASSGKERRRQGRTVLDGPHLVASFLDRGGVPDLVAVSEDAASRQEIAALVARAAGVPVLSFSTALFSQLAPVAHPVGIVAVVKIPGPEGHGRLGPCVVVLDGVQDPGNVGTIIRTAAAAGASDVLLSSDCADPWAPRTLRAGMGGHFALTIRQPVAPRAALGTFAGTVIATVARGGMLPQSVDITGPVALVFGSEGAGLSRDWHGGTTVDVTEVIEVIEVTKVTKVTKVTIPMAPGIESLNVGAAAAILLFERVRQLAVVAAARRA